MSRDEATIALFDIDGTLTPSRGEINQAMLDILAALRKKIVVGVVGGSDFVKQKEQLGNQVLDLVDYSFSENGIVAYKDAKLIHSKSILDHLGNDQVKQFVNFCLRYIADLDIPVKRGTFIEFRTGMINVCPIGRNCSQKEREDFFEYDKEHGIREAMVKALDAKFPELGLKCAIGGQISFDVFPIGWDKTYCLQHLHGFKTIHFFGDKTSPGGNDYEIFADERTEGHTVTSPADTILQLKALFDL